MGPRLGEIYTNRKLMDHFHVGVSSGIRPIKGKNGLLLILDVSSTKPHRGHRAYDDYFSKDDEYLYYFGINSKKEPKYYTPNLELRNSNKLSKNHKFPLYLMIYTGVNHYLYAGRLHYTNKYYHAEHNWLFRLTAKEPTSTNIGDRVHKIIGHDVRHTINNVKNDNQSNRTKDTNNHSRIKNILKHIGDINRRHGSDKPHKNGYHVKAYEYSRREWIKEYARYVAKGTCQYCHKKGPFINYSTNEPYLESHHITPRHEGGLDTIWNVIALCPDCHRMMHYGFSMKDTESKKHLMKIRKMLHKKAAIFAKHYTSLSSKSRS